MITNAIMFAKLVQSNVVFCVQSPLYLLGVREVFVTLDKLLIENSTFHVYCTYNVLSSKGKIKMGLL